MDTQVIEQSLNLIVVALISWFGIGSSILYGRNLVAFEKPFSLELVKHGVYDEKVHRSIMRTSWIGCGILFLASCIIVGLFVRQNVGIGLVMTAVGIFLAFFQKKRQGSSRNDDVRRYIKSHLISMDKEAITRYLQEKYGWTPEQL